MIMAPEEATALRELMTIPEPNQYGPPDMSMLGEIRGTGKIRVTFRVQPDGTVDQVKVDRELSRKAMNAMVSAYTKARFQPAVFDGCHVAWTGSQSFSYQ
jgi:hypothetical protein